MVNLIAPRKTAGTATSSATLSRGFHTPVDATSGALMMTLPTNAAVGVEISVEKVDASANAVTISGTLRGASSTIALTTQYEARTFLSEGNGSWRPISDHRTEASLTAKYLTRTDQLSSLPNVAYWAHRGGAGYAPEETMEAYRISADAGADVLDCDVQPLGDGTLGLMHDGTVNRTTDGAGNVSDYTGPAWRALNAAARFPWNGKSVPPAFLSELISEFAGRKVVSIEPKDFANATQLMDVLSSYSLQRSAIIVTPDRTTLQALKARGFTTYFYWGATTTNPSVSQIVGDGADFLGVDGVSASDATISALVATGRPVIPWTINRRITRDHLLALGVKGFVSDQPVYLKRSTAMRTTDSWRQGVLGHGLLYDGNVSLTLPTVTSGALDLGAAAYQSVTPGEVCPLANAAGSYTIDLDIGFATLPTSTNEAVAVGVGVADDTSRTHDGVANSSPAEYRCYLRAAGGLSLYRVAAGTGGTFTQLGTTQATTALTAGGLAHLRITVTPTTITLARTDGAGWTIGPITDSTLRGGYINLQRAAADGVARFKNLSIT